MEPLGDFIGGSFQSPQGETLLSKNPANGQTVLETKVDPARMTQACDAAEDAYRSWRALSIDDRWEALVRFRAALADGKEPAAEAISHEMGKLRSEARIEINALVGRFDIIRARIRQDLRDGPLPGHPSEVLRHHPHGVVGVVGPFNFPLHLCHSHVVPALLLGNTVVMKPSEVAPLAGQRYAEAAKAAGLPPGVLNVVNGAGASGAALLQDPRLRALAFTGSWPTGRRILESLLDRPEVLVALEMGGKNTSIVLDDADLRQAAHEIVIGGYLTTGQRCTCTDRVLVHRAVKDRFVEILAELVRHLRFGDPDTDVFGGPMATVGQKAAFLAAVKRGEAGGAEEVARGEAPDGHAFAPAVLHVLPDGTHDVDGYTDHELFGPDVHVEAVEDDAEAIAVLNASPYGFANSIFSADRERFDRFFRETSVGVFNWNRSTNQASPRLPFGGTGRSGNFRPAGAYAPRNLAVPVAIQENLPGAFVHHPKVAPYLPPPDLDALAERHAAEEAEEAAEMLVDRPRPLRVIRPRGGRLPKSDVWLGRYYAGGRMVQEKKPGVFDHQRSYGQWFVSIDDPPLSVRDGMTQTATLCAGFAEPEVVRHYVEHGFDDAILSADDTSVGGVPAADVFAERLRALVPGLPHVTFVNSGAESCEKALALCRLAAKPDQRRVLAFEGSFHGRTLLALHASYNPTKRAPFEIAGHEVEFVPFPVWLSPGVGEPPEPEGFLDDVAEGRLDDLLAVWGASDDRLLAREVEILAKIHEHLGAGSFYAVIVEPMQSEGGDRYATARFHRALRLLTRHHGVSLIHDEVQTGFGLGGRFAWHAGFDLVDAEGAPDAPDCVTFAKRAQVGVVMSRFEDPEPTSAHPTSLVRGRIHARMVTGDSHAARIEARTRKHLRDLKRRYPELVHHPRATGYALAFDLPDSAHLMAYLGQRFWRGTIVFGAGDRTVRYRLNRSFELDDVDALFESVRRSLSWLDAHPNQTPPAWEDEASPPPEPQPEAVEIRLRELTAADRDHVIPVIRAIEARAYEPARRDSAEHLGLAFDDPDGVAIVAELRDGESWRIVGCALGTPLERVGHVVGPKRDPMLGRNNTFYSLAVTVDPDFHGHGLGRRLKRRQLEAAAAKTKDGEPRYTHGSGRNRAGRTASMQHLNLSYGASELFRMVGAYEDETAEAVYYRAPMGRFRIDPLEASVRPEQDPARDLATGIARPFATPPRSLRDALDDGSLFGPTVNKITICNYITPAVVRAVEWVDALVPSLPHMYLTSSRDETFDKTVRTLRYHRTEGQVVLGFDGGYVGHTTAAARSLSDPSVHRQGPGYFETFARVAHPDDGGEATIAALREAVQKAGGASRVLGLFVEPVQERTGRVVADDFWPALAALRDELDLPVVLVETASGSYRSGRGAFHTTPVDFTPDALVWWGGGQTGFVHLSAKYFVDKPLTMVSTWDGDELSLVRIHHQLRAARGLDVAAAASALDAALAPARDAGLTVRGSGLYRTLVAGPRADTLVEALSKRGLRGRRYPNDVIALSPPLDVDAAVFDELRTALGEAL